ncbi:MAG: hypothetical protein GY822_24210 [Deltaproteobacteria bacterium]|nr:hypothetical protein [Deltaproteobacteria bacterium]
MFSGDHPGPLMVKVQVQPAACCILGLHWELLFEGLSASRVLVALASMGFSDRSLMPEVRTFHSQTGE